MKFMKKLGALLLLFFFLSNNLLAIAAEGNSASTAIQAAAKPLVVFVYDKSCKISCSVVRPILNELQDQYGEKVQFVWLDVSKDSRDESRKTAKALGVSRFLEDCEDWYPAVGIFSAGRKCIKQLLGSRSRKDYVSAIDKAISSTK